MHFDASIIGFDTIYTMLHKAVTRIRNQSCRSKEIEDDYRLENIQLKMSLHCTDIDRYVVSDHLGHGHGHCFRLSWINFSRHDRRSRLIGRYIDFPNTTAWTRSQQ